MLYYQLHSSPFMSFLWVACGCTPIVGLVGFREYTYVISLNIARPFSRMAQPVYTLISMQEISRLLTSTINYPIFTFGESDSVKWKQLLNEGIISSESTKLLGYMVFTSIIFPFEVGPSISELSLFKLRNRIDSKSFFELSLSVWSLLPHYLKKLEIK